MRKVVSGGIGKKVVSTGVRKPRNTCASPTPHYMPEAVKDALKHNTIDNLALSKLKALQTTNGSKHLVCLGVKNHRGTRRKCFQKVFSPGAPKGVMAWYR